MYEMGVSVDFRVSSTRRDPCSSYLGKNRVVVFAPLKLEMLVQPSLQAVVGHDDIPFNSICV